MIKGAAGSEMKSVKELLVKANIAGETTTDIILRTWPMKDINYVFNAAVK